MVLSLTNNDFIVQQAILNLWNNRDSTGLIKNPDQKFIDIENSLVWIDMVYDYIQYRNDTQFVMPVVPGISKILDWFEMQIGSNGMLGLVSNNIDILNTEMKDKMYACLSLHLVYTSRKAASVYQMFGKKKEARRVLELSENIALAVYNNCLDADKSLIADNPFYKQFSQVTNAFAVLTNTVAQIEYEKNLEKVLNDTHMKWCTPDQWLYIYEALSKAGMGKQLALQLEYLPKRLNAKMIAYNSYIQKAIPAFIILNTMLGLTTEPDCSIIIRPVQGVFNKISSAIILKQGDVNIEIEADKSEILSGMIILPENANGKIFWNRKCQNLYPGKQKIKIK